MKNGGDFPVRYVSHYQRVYFMYNSHWHILIYIMEGAEINGTFPSLHPRVPRSGFQCSILLDVSSCSLRFCPPVLHANRHRFPCMLLTVHLSLGHAQAITASCWRDICLHPHQSRWSFEPWTSCQWVCRPSPIPLMFYICVNALLDHGFGIFFWGVLGRWD